MIILMPIVRLKSFVLTIRIRIKMNIKERKERKKKTKKIILIIIVLNNFVSSIYRARKQNRSWNGSN